MSGCRGSLLLIFSILLAAFAGAGCHRENQGVRVLVLTAVDNEYDAVKSLVPDGRERVLEGRETTVGEVNGIRVAVMRGGWGKAQSAAATAIGIHEFSPAIVLFAGVGAGVDPARATSGDVVIVESSFQYDLGEKGTAGFQLWAPETPTEKAYPSGNFESSGLTGMALAAAKKVPLRAWELQTQCVCSKDGVPAGGCAAPIVLVGRSAPRVCKGVAATADTFLADPAVAGMLAKTKNVSVVDMETAAVAEETINSGVQFLAVRVIADMPNGSNENLYYCLKPPSAERLHAVIGSILEELAIASTNSSALANSSEGGQGDECAIPKARDAGAGSSDKSGSTSPK
jgi:adenosylhomocysteine nucleosidase